MEKIVEIKVDYLGRILKPVSGETRIALLVGESENGPWTELKYPTEKTPKGGRYVNNKDESGSIFPKLFTPNYGSDSQTNNDIYLKAEDLEEDIWFRVDGKDVWLMMLTDCERCINIDPTQRLNKNIPVYRDGGRSTTENKYQGWWVVNKGKVDNFLNS